MKTRIGAAAAHGASVSTINNIKPLTALQLEGSPTLARERAFFETCAVAAKLTVRHGEVEVEAALTVGDEAREYFEDGPIPIRGGLLRDIARDLGVALDVRREE